MDSVFWVDDLFYRALVCVPIVQRSKKILDFIFTLFFIHFLFCWVINVFLSVQCVSHIGHTQQHELVDPHVHFLCLHYFYRYAFVNVVYFFQLAETFCIHSEMQDIQVSTIERKPVTITIPNHDWVLRFSIFFKILFKRHEQNKNDRNGECSKYRACSCGWGCFLRGFQRSFRSHWYRRTSWVTLPPPLFLVWYLIQAQRIQRVFHKGTAQSHLSIEITKIEEFLQFQE